MAIFVVLPRAQNPKLDAVITASFAADSIQLAPNQWLISFPGTVIALSEKLGVTGDGGQTGSAVIAQIGSYYGRAPQVVWDWIKTKLESSNG
jgi:hypothetical protein